MILLISCFNLTNRLQYIKEKWLNDCQIPYLIVLGNPFLHETYNYDEKNKILYVKCEDYYDDLVYKVYLGIKYIYKNFNPEFILKIDDDVIVNNEMLNAWLKNRDRNIQYCGKPSYRDCDSIEDYGIAKFKRPENKTTCIVPKVYLCLGPMYFLGRKAIEILVREMDPKRIKLEDVNVGITLNKWAIFPSNKIVLFQDNKSEKHIGWHDIARLEVPL
jgi:hypothetical protein